MDAQRIRIIHTADLHLECSFASLNVNSRLGNVLRKAQLEVFDRIVERAQQWPADIVCIAGDLFHSIRVSRTTVNHVLEGLERLAPIQVFIAPGECDPFTAESPYALEDWPDNVTIFPPGGWHAIVHASLPLTVHGIGFDGKDATGRYFSELDIPQDRRVHIALAHGTVQGRTSEEEKSFAPFTVEDIACDRLAYLALGHLHDIVEVKGEFRTVIQYPGTPQGCSFKETGAKYMLEVEVFQDGTRGCRIASRPVEVSDIQFDRMDFDIGQAPEASKIFDAHAAGDSRKRVVRLRLCGVRPPLAFSITARLLESARSRYLWAEVVDETTFTAESLLPIRDNTCISKLVDLAQARITDELDRGSALRESEALELILNACRGDGFITYRRGDLSS